MDTVRKSLPLRSADVSFAFIALAKNLITKQQHRAAIEQILTFRARQDETSMESLLLRKGLLNSHDAKRISKTQCRHLRICESCQKKTYRLPNQKKEKILCEYCGADVRRPTAAESLVFQTLERDEKEKEAVRKRAAKQVKLHRSHEHLEKFLESKRANAPVRFVRPRKPSSRSSGTKRS